MLFIYTYVPLYVIQLLPAAVTMSQSFISYRLFEHKVAECLANAVHFKQYKHVLPSIPWRHRQRFLDTLYCGCDIPISFDLLIPAQKLPHNNYMRFVQFAKGKKSQLHPHLS
ncbi:MAG: hypothetical protein EOP51_05265 [Sphingobacteriales bacterium]|nr:MAG: hypothetical protein EOP51_05265 [Sphingobacteriales bacterium]